MKLHDKLVEMIKIKEENCKMQEENQNGHFNEDDLIFAENEMEANLKKKLIAFHVFIVVVIALLLFFSF
ncbi:hypothetical protein NUSPORA_00197 [Nucleospora cyclopteri]